MKQIVKYAYVYSLFLMFVFCASCGGKNEPERPKENIKGGVSPSKSDEKYHTEYEYTDANGKRLIIQNSLPKGGPYIHPNGKEYFKLVFWTRLINETASPLELKIDFPGDSYEVPGLPGKYYRVLIPPDTMTMDKEPLADYGIIGLKLFLDNNIHKPSSLTRTINPKESGGFYVVILCDKGVGGPFRTGLSLKAQNLVYRISRYAGKEQPVSETEIHCGTINLKNLMLSKSREGKQ